MDTEAHRATPPGDDLHELRVALGGLCFPALRDEVILELLAREAPARLLRRVMEMSPAERYGSLEDLCAKVEQGGGGHRTRPPWA